MCIEFIQVPKFLWGRVNEIGIHRLEPTERDLEEAADVAERDGFERIYCYCDGARFRLVEAFVSEHYADYPEVNWVRCRAEVFDLQDKRWDSKRGRSAWQFHLEQRQKRLVSSDKERLRAEFARKHGRVPR